MNINIKISLNITLITIVCYIGLLDVDTCFCKATCCFYEYSDSNMYLM